MKDNRRDFLGIVAVVTIAILAYTLYRYRKEGWYPTTTYVNSPGLKGVYPTQPYGPWGGNYYYRLNWEPWGYHHPGFRYQGAVKIPPTPIRYSAMPYPTTPYPTPPAYPEIGYPTPLNALRWNYPWRPMLTSVKSPKDLALGQWVRAGTAYTDNPNDFTVVDVFQLNLDPIREIFSYSVKTKDGQTIPINLPPFHKRLEDRDRFVVQGWEGKGDFVFSEADKYSYIYQN